MNHPGHSLGIRPPDIDETPLSWAEVEVAVQMGLVADPLGIVDRFPVRQVIRKAGTWECDVQPRGMWEALIA